MEHELCHISEEKDLTVYEQQLADINKLTIIPKQKNLFASYLTIHKGKLVKVELSCNSACKFKVGILLDVGEDFVAIRVGNTCISTVIPFENIECISFIHNNDRRLVKLLGQR